MRSAQARDPRGGPAQMKTKPTRGQPRKPTHCGKCAILCPSARDARAHPQTLECRTRCAKSSRRKGSK